MEKEAMITCVKRTFQENQKNVIGEMKMCSYGIFLLDKQMQSQNNKNGKSVEESGER
jgi:hypothetical protein